MRRIEDRRPEHELRSFGRRRGRKFSARQERLVRERLPSLSLDLSDPPPEPLTDLFSEAARSRRASRLPIATASPASPAGLLPKAASHGEPDAVPRSKGPPEGVGTPVREVWLEIGFGGAEHMIWQASRHPEIGIIGCEPFGEGVAKALSALEEQGRHNVLIHPDDVRPVLRWMPAASLGRVFILFPDPWPKKRHVKRRLVAGPLLGLLAGAMKPGAELRIATDVGDYARTILAGVLGHCAFRWPAASPADWRERGPDWPQTRYEKKALEEGRHRYYFRFIRA